jgi:hypothetical protein
MKYWKIVFVLFLLLSVLSLQGCDPFKPPLEEGMRLRCGCVSVDVALGDILLLSLCAGTLWMSSHFTPKK